MIFASRKQSEKCRESGYLLNVVMLMMLKRLQIRSVFSTLTLNPRFRRITIILRYYAAHRDGSKSSSAPSLSQSLDHSGLPGKKLLTDSFTAESSSPQYVGPFNLGVAPSLQLGSNVKAKKWNELSTSGKGIETFFFLAE